MHLVVFIHLPGNDFYLFDKRIDVSGDKVVESGICVKITIIAPPGAERDM